MNLLLLDLQLILHGFITMRLIQILSWVLILTNNCVNLKSVFNIAKHAYVITRNPANFENTNKVSFYTYEQFLQEFETSDETFLVCGGAQIYNLFAGHIASWFVTTIKNPCANKHENNEFKVNKLKSLKFVKTIVANGSCNGYNFNIVELN